MIILVMSCLQSRSQQVINAVTMEKLSSGSFRIQYKLNSPIDYDIEKTVLKIFRRREGKIEEIFSKDITSENSKPQGLQVYNYTWKPANGAVKTGDELQAKIELSYKPSLAKQKELPNKTPYADAGNSLEVELPITEPIALNGSKSRDEDGTIVSSEWKQIAGPTNLTIQKKDSLIAFANGEFKEGTYAFELIIKDDQGATAISRTVLSVKSAPFVINTTPVNTAPKKDSPVVSKIIPVPENTKTKIATKLKGGPSNALVNLLLPGVGHYFVSGDHNGENRKAGAFILTAVYAGSIGGAVYFNGKSNDQYKKYNELANYREYQKDANGVIIGTPGGSEQEANKYLNNAKSSHRNTLICLGVGGGVLVGDLIYTLVKGSKNRKDWKTENISFRPNLIFSTNGFGTTAGVQFKF